MSKQIESTATQAEQTTALVKYGPAVLNRGEGDASERTLLLNAYTFAFGFGAVCLAKAIRSVRSAFGRRSE